jgi:hypothetical protein
MTPTPTQQHISLDEVIRLYNKGKHDFQNFRISMSTATDRLL